MFLEVRESSKSEKAGGVNPLSDGVLSSTVCLRSASDHKIGVLIGMTLFAWALNN